MRRPADKVCNQAHLSDTSDERLLIEMKGRLDSVREFSVFAHLRETDPGAYQAIEMMALEVLRQRDGEDWTIAHDDTHSSGEMANAAACYALRAGQAPNDHRHGPGYPPSQWPWDAKWWKPKTVSRNLIRAGALLAAEHGRWMRAWSAGFGNREHDPKQAQPPEDV